MGYYVTGDGSFTIAEVNEYRALADMHELNKHDDLKRGGAYAGGKRTELWFSWLSADYPSETPTLQSMLEMLGFDVERVADVDAGFAKYTVRYDNKTGQESLFLEKLSQYAVGQITWQGEDGDAWIDKFDAGPMTRLTGQMVFKADK